MSKILSALLAAACLALAGCNTIAGMGDDIKAGGEKITSGSEKVKDKM
ncbi:MAG: entericidin EcnA/B family protein [Lautropia sp.]|nr:entericidin EcnA/B family protein [Lautropia sp.]